MSAKYKSPSFLLPNEINTNTNPLNTDGNPATGTGINSLYSMDFTVGKKIQLGSTSNFNFGDGDWSVCWWMKLGTLPGQTFNPLIDIGGYADAITNAFIIYIHNTRVINVYKRSGVNLGTSSITVKSLEWNFCTLVKENQTITLNIFNSDNQSPEVLTTSASGNFGNSTGNSYLAGQNSSGTRYYDGKLDEVSIFNRALNTTEIAALYDGTGSNIRPSNLIASNLNPIAYYPLGEQAQNSGYLSASGNEWQFPNGVLQDYVMDFDGATVGDYIDVGDIPLEGVYTISFWINPDASPSNLYFLLDKGDGSSNISTRVTQSSNNTIRFQIGSSNFSSTDTLTNNSWNNVILIANGSNSKIYINNGAAATGTLTTAPNTTQSLFIGTDQGKQSTYYFSGQMSNIVIWNSDQSANIANIYNNGSPQTSYTVTPQNWWKLNADSVYTPSAPNYTTALDFNGTSDFIDITQSGTLPPNSGDFTYSTWVNIDPNTSLNIIVLLNKGDAWPGNGILIRYRSHFEVLMNGVVYAFNDATFKSLSTPGVWRHFALVFDETANTLTAYVDTNKHVLSATTTLNVSDANFIIGKRQNNIQYFKGKMSNLAVYNSALTDSQISTLFNFGTPETTPSFSPAAWWKLDNITTGIQDSSGNGNNGANNGAAEVPSGVAFTPSWKIPSALTIPTVNYTSALEFNNPITPNNNEYVDIGTISFLNQAGDFTISQWVNPVNIVGNNHMPIQFGFDDFIYLKGSAWQYEFRGEQRQYVPTNGVPVPKGEWIHIALTVEGTVSKFYQNGDLKHTGVVGTTYSANAVRIGNYYSASYPWYGQISNTALFNSALSSSNVTTLYNNGQPEATPSFSPLHWWKLDNTTTGIQDSVGSSNGTLVQTSTPGAQEVATNVYVGSIPVNGVSTTLPSTALQQSDLQFDSPYSNYSLSFDGTVGVTTGGITAITPSNSICFWFNNSTAAGGLAPLIASLNYISGALQNFAIRLETTNKLTVVLLKNGNYVFLSSNTVLANNTWHFVTLTTSTSGSNVTNTLYINGTQDVTNTGLNNSNLADLVNGLTIGYWLAPGSATYNFNGKIDETSIFNYSLSAAQVLEIYNNGKPSNLFDYSGTAPISWWRLGENAYFDNNNVTLPNSITGAPNGVSSGTATSMLSADAPGTYANGVGTNLDIVDRVGDAPLSVANSQSYNMIPDDKVPYVPGYVGLQTTNTSEMTFDGINDYITIPNISLSGEFTLSWWMKRTSYANTNNYFFGEDNANNANWVRFNNGDLDIKIGASNGFYYQLGDQGTKPNFTFTNGSWYNVVITRDSNFLIQAYVNGLVDPNYTPLRLPRSTATPVSFAPNTFGRKNTTYLDGIIDEIVIFDKALTADQVKFDLYKPSLPLGSNKTANISNNPNLPTPVAWYRMGDPQP